MKKILLLVSCIFMMNVAFSQDQPSKPIVLKPVYFDVSPPLTDMIKIAPAKADNSWKDGVVKNQFLPFDGEDNPVGTNPNVQTWFGSVPDSTTLSFDGTAGDGSLLPPDTDGDVGPNHYFQVINCKYAIYNKSGAKLAGPTNNSSIFQGMPNNSNDGDAVVLYDENADRWLFSQFSLPHYPNGPFFEMVAISQTPDPTGAWYRYEYQFSELPDYPKIGVWPDGYYMTINRFLSGNYKGTGAVAMDRTKMLAGDPAASMIYITLGASADPYAVLPSDCDGEFPPMGTPNYFTYQKSSHLSIYEFHADWITPANSTYTLATTLQVNPVSSAINVGIPQKGTSIKLDHFLGRIMFRLPFRKFNDHWAMVASGGENVGSDVTGIRWYELRKVGNNPWGIYQQATYSPDNNSRWLPSIALDSAGNIAMGFSISSSTMYPSIHYTGRMACDPLNQMTIAEGAIMNGNGSQTASWSGTPSRWGDYSSMSVDPSAPMNFWYTSEYYANMSQANYKTRIGSISFADILSISAFASPSQLCSGQSSQLSAVAGGGTGTFTYSWTSIPAGFTSSIPNPVVTPTVTTQYVVSLSDGVSTKNDTVMINVAAEPTAFAGNDTSWINTLTMWPVYGVATYADSVRWKTEGDGIFLNGNMAYALYKPGVNDISSGAVQLSLTVYPISPCASIDIDTVDIDLVPVGINENEMGNTAVKLTPNPSNGVFTLALSGSRGPVQIVITDTRGTTVYEEQVTSWNSAIEKRINLSKKAKGLYFVKVTSNGNTSVVKMIVR